MDLLQLYCEKVIKPLELHLDDLERFYRKNPNKRIALLIEKTEKRKDECYRYLEELIDSVTIR